MLDHYTTPGESIEIRDNQTIYSLLTDRLARTGADTVIAAKKIGPGRWQNVTTGEFHERVVSAAKGLIALGIAKGDAVTIFSSTRLEWGILDFALAAVGAVSVPIYDTDSAPQAQRIMNDSAVKLAFADNRERFDRLDSVKDHCPALKQILMIEGNALGALEGLGVAVSDEELNERVATVRADDLATIVYTSGSTGNPKGAELTHKNFVSITISASQALHEVVLDDHPRLLLFLPLAHCFARFIQYASIASDDGVVGYLPDTKTCCRTCVRLNRPTCWACRACSRRCTTPPRTRPVPAGRAACLSRPAEAARVWSRKEQAGEQHTFAEIAERAKYETLVYRTVRGALGPKIKYVACGGAPLSLDLAHFYNGIGLPMIQGYGMTETAAPFAATRVTDNVIGTVGQPAPGSSIRISDEGELQVKGPNVFCGYHNLPEKTAEAFTADGWLRTGDLAEIDDEGHIVITGRIKDIIITAGGKNVSPIPLEEEIAKCPIVEHCVVVGDQRPFIGALVTLDPESLALWLPAHGLSTETPVDRLATNAAVREEIQQYVDKANATVSRAESVRKFAVLDTQFTQENKCLTPSLKVVRPAVNRVFADVIDNEIYNGKR